MASIYLVEDNKPTLEAVKGYLQLADHQVIGFENLADIRNTLERQLPDLILLDIMLPDGDGFIFAKEFLSKHSIPLIFMSARETESDRVTGFEIGADDYIVKPFSPRELVFRVAAVLKRAYGLQSTSSATVWEFDEQILSTDESTHRATLNGEALKLTATEWKILQFLSSNNGVVITREQILEQCLEYSFEGYDRTVDTHIKNLRAKLGQSGWIETVRGYGYRFAGTNHI